MRPAPTPPPTDWLLRALAGAAVFVGLGFLGRPNGFWLDLTRLVAGGTPRPSVYGLAVAAIGFVGLAYLLGAALETALVAAGVRLTRQPVQEADYDDHPPDG
jgi:hypothetical protein